MKEKRYFCDWGNSNPSPLFKVLIYVAFAVIICVTAIVRYNNSLSTYKNLLDAYPESTYQYLESIADTVVQEGVGINFLAFPDDIVKYEITSENHIITLTYHVDYSQYQQILSITGIPIGSFPTMTVKLSDNYQIISKIRNYHSEAHYLRNTKIFIAIEAALFSSLAVVILCTVIFIISGISYFVSRANKKKSIP